MLLARTVALADGVLPPEELYSGQFYTQFTLDAETVTEQLTGAAIDTALTRAEMALRPGAGMPAGGVQAVQSLNMDAMAYVQSLAGFQTNVGNSVFVCKMFTTEYPLVYDHVLKESNVYFEALTNLQNGEPVSRVDMPDQLVFWDTNLAQHAEFNRGMLNPTETYLIHAANETANKMHELAAESSQIYQNPQETANLTARTYDAAVRVSRAAAAETSGLLQCRIKSIILPILSDHYSRETNRYVYSLTQLHA